MESMENANAEKHYKLLVLAIIVGIIGVFLRFAGDINTPYFSWISNLILVIGVIIALRAVFSIMK